MPTRTPYHKEPLDAVVGGIVGLFLGGVGGLLAHFGRIEAPWVFVIVGTVVTVAVCAVLGYHRGSDFFREIRETPQRRNRWFDWW
jgi:mannose/fructose/N-acetylgalactosamine-specific phosphotransferase system component IID